MGKYSTFIFACLRTACNKPFNWGSVTLNFNLFFVDCFNLINSIAICLDF